MVLSNLLEALSGFSENSFISKIRKAWPSWLRFGRPRFNFITLHYLYMIVMTLLTSVILYGGGNLPFVDALFFGSGASTQSGLNTIDVNNLLLYQQIVIFFTACLTNPIIINTFVVFVRLYWFEKRFQRIVLEARNLRRIRSRSRTRSMGREERDAGKEEQGVNGRDIVVLRDDSEQRNDSGDASQPEQTALGDIAESTSSSDRQSDDKASPVLADPFVNEKKDDFPAFRRDITFADDPRGPRHVRRGSDAYFRMPEHRSPEQHIAFLEKQRQQSEGETLIIPGPRDFDRGMEPTAIEQSQMEGSPLERPYTRAEDDTTAPEEKSDPEKEEPKPNQFFRRNITIDEPERPRSKTEGQTPKVNFSRPARRNSFAEMASELRNRGRTRTLNSFFTTRSEERDPMPYLSWQPTIGRNSAFVDLTEEQREELGGIEYRALKTLALVLVCYFVGFHLLGMICLLPWIMRTHWISVPRENGLGAPWWGIFTPASMFNDLGFTLTPDSMISFQTAVWPLLLGTFLIIIGNTGFPCFLRFIIWVASKVVPRGSGIWEELRFLLDHPRRCFTLLFPSKANWWLFGVLIVLNAIDVIFFIILDINDETVSGMKPGYRVLAGIFQAASTRTAGFSVVNLAELHPAVQVSYMIMMYISVFPVAISIRRTNVYEERSLGIYSSNDDDDAEGPEKSYVATHLRRQLSFDLWYVFLGLFLICIIEGPRLEDHDDWGFTIFTILFEIISAYGTVGLSLGYPTINASFSAELKTLSKLIIIAMELRGRHRGLPYALDRAILLPSESLQRKEAADALRRAQRRNSNASQIDASAVNGSGPGAQEPRPGQLPRRSSMAASVKSGRSTNFHLTRILSGALSAGPLTPHKNKGH